MTERKAPFSVAAGALMLALLTIVPAASAAAWGGPTSFGENWPWETKPCSAFSTDSATGGQLGASTARLLGDATQQVRVSFRSLTQSNIGTVYDPWTAYTWMTAASGPHIVGAYHECHNGKSTNT